MPRFRRPPVRLHRIRIELRTPNDETLDLVCRGSGARVEIDLDLRKFGAENLHGVADAIGEVGGEVRKLASRINEILTAEAQDGEVK